MLLPSCRPCTSSLFASYLLSVQTCPELSFLWSSINVAAFCSPCRGHLKFVACTQEPGRKRQPPEQLPFSVCSLYNPWLTQGLQARHKSLLLLKIHEEWLLSLLSHPVSYKSLLHSLTYLPNIPGTFLLFPILFFFLCI